MAQRFYCASCVLVLALTAAFANATAYAEPLPDDRGVRYAIREVPSDPNSHVIWTVDLSLEAVDVIDGLVAWDIVSITISEYDGTGNSTRAWTDSSPVVDTTDGLWWVQHVDAQNIELAEFALPPLSYGLAAAQLGTPTALDYDFQGKPFSPEPGDPLYGMTATAIDYVFTLENQGTPEEDAEDEPVTVIDLPDYPIG